MGVPAVGSNVDGVPEVVLDGQTGLPVPAQDGKALIERLPLAGRPAFPPEHGHQMLPNLSHRKFSREVMAQGMERLYQRLLEAR